MCFGCATHFKQRKDMAMKVMLLVPPTDLKGSYGKLKKFSNPQPAIGMAYIAAVLRNDGIDVKIIDAYVNEYALSEILSVLGEFEPDVVGISVLTPSADVVCELARAIRAVNSSVKIVMGNMHASLFAEELLLGGYADIIVHREGEVTVLELVHILEKCGSLHGVAGISFKEGDEVIHNPLRPHIEDLDSLPYPAWDLMPLDKYNTDPRTVIKTGCVEQQILASRGCPNQCTFCSSRTEKSLGSKYRMRSPSKVVDEMLYMHDRYGSKVFSFMDLAFPLVKQHAIELCKEIIGRRGKREILWSTECRVKPLDKETLEYMKESGCCRVNFGIESGSIDILKSLKKNFTVDDVRVATRMAKEVGLEVDGMFMIGLPGETESAIRQTISLAISIDVRYAIFNIFVPYPGCELWDTLNAQKKISYKQWSDFTSYPTYGGGVPVYVPDGLSHKRLMELQSMAMRKFYLRPKFILSELRNFKFNKISHYWDGFLGLMSSHSRG